MHGATELPQPEERAQLSLAACAATKQLTKANQTHQLEQAMKAESEAGKIA